jgi:hypothetical protein
MVGLQLLPILGGAPAVWATALAFFQPRLCATTCVSFGRAGY